MAIPQASALGKATLGADRVSQGSVRLEITNWQEVMRTLIKLDKDYVRELRKDFKAIAKPVQQSIKKAIPSKAKPPLSQMRQVHFGRLAWGTTYGNKPKPTKSVLIQLPNTRAKKYKGVDAIAITRLQVGSAAVVLTDMAGRKGYTKGRRGMTPEYDYMYTINGVKVPGKRKHRVVPLAFAKGLAKAKYLQQRGASRFVWPSAMKALPDAQRKMDQKITEVNRKISMKLKDN